MANDVWIGTASGWTTGSNWTAATSPTTGDNAFVTNNATVINSSLDNHTVGLSTFNLVMDFSGQVGVNGTTNQYLQIAATTVNIGLPIAGGSNSPGTNLFNWNGGTTSSTINVLNTSNAGSAVGQAPVKLLGSALSVFQSGGIISIAQFPTETATVSTFNVVSSGTGLAPQAYIGAGCNLSTLIMNGGSVTLASQQLVTSAKIARAGTNMTHIGTGGFATLQIDANAKVYYVGNGSVNSLILTGLIDLTAGAGAVAFGSMTIYRGASFIDPQSRASFVTTPVLSGASMRDITVDLGQGRIF